MQNGSRRLCDSMYSLDADVLAFPLIGAVAAQLAAITALQMRTTSPLVDIGSAHSPIASERASRRTAPAAARIFPSPRTGTHSQRGVAAARAR
ncbi:hypothetical protein CUR178_08182 [Leishmania enriettii]|uniref:Uncharacterized protein n=1 Tax=Leishmania enriettii TaxID=5663 RepID=A0A836HN50_LEIEN|nr:hypothetical protein CUR178_08182 [Leishmania enriettii]